LATQTAPTIQSILSADFGSVNTRAVLLDVVGGQYRLVSRAQTLTTDAPPVVDVGVGLRRALDEMSSLTGRVLVHGDDVILGTQEDGSGVDIFLATSSGGRPMKTVLVGLMPDVSIATGRRALASTYVELTDTLSLADIRSTENQLNAILHNKPDLIFIVGGTDFGATESVISLLKTVRLAVMLTRETKPVVLYAGNEALKPIVNEMLGNEVTLFMANNVRPTIFEEKLAPAQLELAMVYGAYKSANAGGYTEIQHTSNLGVLPTAQSYSNVVRYLGELPGAGIGVMCVDVGSSTVTICASIRKQPYITIRSDLGLGHSAVSGVKAVGARNVQRWLTFNASEADIMDYAYNKSLRPSTVPQTSQDLELEYALARELIRNAVAGARAGWRGIPRGDLLPAMRPIIGAGAVLGSVIDPGIGALLMLDALQPVGISELRLDPYGVIAALGSVAYIEPLALVQVLETGGLFNLGTAISPLGITKDSKAMDVTVKIGGRTIQRSVGAGTIQVIDLPSGQKGRVTIKLSSGLTLNGRREVTLDVEGGAAGLILDGRGRPFSPPKDIERRAQVLPRWYAAVRSDSKG
jgi:uncharacterized protein (TIGR01319 family)